MRSGNNFIIGAAGTELEPKVHSQTFCTHKPNLLGANTLGLSAPLPLSVIFGLAPAAKSAIFAGHQGKTVSETTLREFQRELNSVKTRMHQLCLAAEEALGRAVLALEKRDAALAAEVIAGDRDIDRQEVEIEDLCLETFALFQPVAGDLRFLVAVIKINNDIERIGDLAVNIAERVQTLLGEPWPDTDFDFLGLAHQVQAMIRKSVQALIQGDVELARDVLAMDNEIDERHRAMYGTVRSGMIAHPDQAYAQLQLLGISRNLERVADHATNIAEDVIYLVDGTIVRHGRL